MTENLKNQENWKNPVTKSGKKDLNIGILSFEDMEKSDILTFFVFSILIFIIAYIFELNLVLVLVGIIIYLIIVFFKKPLSKMFLL